MKRFVSIMTLCLVFLTLLTLPAFGAKELVVDTAKLLSEDEIAALSAQLEEYGNKHDMDFAVVTVFDTEGDTVGNYADDYYDAYGYGSGEEYSGALLLHCVESREWYISTHGTAIDVFTQDTIDEIGNEIAPYLASGRFYEAYTTFAMQCDAAATHQPLSWYWFVAALLIGLFIAWIVVSAMKSELKTVRSKAQAHDYIRADSLKLNVCHDVFLFRHVTRRAKPKVNASPTHTSSSGRTHGGGGGRY